METDDRPVIRCLIAWEQQCGDYVLFAVRKEPVTLEQAKLATEYGAHMLVDPCDEIDLATFERHRRWWRKWERDNA